MVKLDNRMQRTHINPLDLTPTSIFVSIYILASNGDGPNLPTKLHSRKKKLWQGKVKAEDDPATIAWYW